ncbi:hypothetical protein ILUMI_15252 [Ignelater luminosus]|uniref:Uncharacterized protein n=1 Tax=Ignelater luminosus TaxID=2038154 RepID=A0A8K0CTE3_IGNLU|nr:hypothetical protein ILUMI_15252 [Ignelater luminosus]
MSSRQVEIRKKIVYAYNQNNNMSQSKLAKSLGTANQQPLCPVSVDPNCDSTKEQLCKTRTHKLFANFLTKTDCIVIGDETCVKADFKQLPGQQFYVAYKRGDASDKFKTITVDKFAKKFLVW